MSALLPYAAIDPAWAARQRAAFRTLRPSPPDSSFPAFLFGRLLEDDLHSSCRPVLPADVSNLHGVTVQGMCILQIVDMANIGATFEQRTEDARGPTRTLKLCLTDGHQLAYGFEFAWLPQFSTQTPRGSKVAVQDVDVRHGLLLLTPQNCQLLGAAAEAAEQQQTEADKSQAELPTGAYSAALTTSQFGTVAGSATTPRGNFQRQEPPPEPVAVNSGPSRTIVMTAATSTVTSTKKMPPPPVFVDVISSDDDCSSDTTDPMIEHLFYSPNTPKLPPTAHQKAPAGTTNNATRKRPRPSASPVVVLTDEKRSRVPANSSVIVIDAEAEQRQAALPISRPAPALPPPKPADPTLPFQYFSVRDTQPSSALQAPRGSPVVAVRAFVQSVVGFQFSTGQYQLRVLVEDCTQVREADVAPAFVQRLMGVSCAEFQRAMQQTPALAHRWAARMQLALMTLEGIMSFRQDTSSGALTLLNCRDVAAEDARRLLERVRFARSSSASLS